MWTNLSESFWWLQLGRYCTGSWVPDWTWRRCIAKNCSELAEVFGERPRICLATCGADLQVRRDQNHTHTRTHTHTQTHTHTNTHTHTPYNEKLVTNVVPDGSNLVWFSLPMLFQISGWWASSFVALMNCSCILCLGFSVCVRTKPNWWIALESV